MNEAQKRKLQKYGVIAVSILLISYIVYQAYMMTYNPVETELAYEYTIEDTMDAEVFVARAESYINNSKKGTIISAVEDGSRVSKNQPVAYVFSDTAAADTFTEGESVDVSGVSKGKGFQGVVRRHNFNGVNDATHGQHNRGRKPGSIGACSYPAKVFKGMRMAGQMGGDQVTTQNLQVLKVIPEHNLLLIKGSIPGYKGSIVSILK